jgi:predicted hydrocarbon binding protein
MGEKVMVDFPGFITRDKVTHHLLVGDHSAVLFSNSIIAELYRQMFKSLGYEKTSDLLYRAVEKGAYEVQRKLIKAYHLKHLSQDEFKKRVLRLPLQIDTYGYGRGSVIAAEPDIIFKVTDSSLAKSLKGFKVDGGACFHLSGFFAGMTQAYAELLDDKNKYQFVETQCILNGAPHCEFKLIEEP